LSRGFDRWAQDHVNKEGTSMLVLTRKPGESIVIGSDIVVKVLEAGPGKVRIGIEAPRNVHVLRGELHKNSEDSDYEQPALAGV